MKPLIRVTILTAVLITSTSIVLADSIPALRGHDHTGVPSPWHDWVAGHPAGCPGRAGRAHAACWWQPL